jgi:hypothetical protein
MRTFTFQCIRVHPYALFNSEVGLGCGSIFVAAKASTLCSFCGNYYVRLIDNLVPTAVDGPHPRGLEQRT